MKIGASSSLTADKKVKIGASSILTADTLQFQVPGSIPALDKTAQIGASSILR